MPASLRSRQPPPGVVRLDLDFRPFARAVQQLDAALRAAAASVARLGAVLRPLRPAPPPIPLHGFTPNYDLACTVCGAGPEECKGGRA